MEIVAIPSRSNFNSFLHPNHLHGWRVIKKEQTVGRHGDGRLALAFVSQDTVSI